MQVNRLTEFLQNEQQIWCKDQLHAFQQNSPVLLTFLLMFNDDEHVLEACVCNESH